MNRIKLFLLDLFFPNRCPSCDRVIGYDRLICEECIANLEKCKTDKNRVCSVCGKDYCENHDYLYYEHTVSCFYYEKEARNGIISMKNGNKNFGYYLGELLSDKILSDDIMKNADFVVAVPMSKQSFRQRGYNQAHILADMISRKTGIPLLENVLFKNKSKAQHELSSAERYKNVSAFYSEYKDLSDKRIIVCDDVLTTGNTMNRCAQLLINLNAKAVYAASATIIKHKKE